jgi:hypothetical protein
MIILHVFVMLFMIHSTTFPYFTLVFVVGTNSSFSLLLLRCNTSLPLLIQLPS